MHQQIQTIQHIPAIVWGDRSTSVYLVVHGKQSSKEEAFAFAQIATQKGHQVLSFDLPEHGERKQEGIPCDVHHGMSDLRTIGDYAMQNWTDIRLLATSLGAYFSLLAYEDVPLTSCLFVSPILNMERLIRDMMLWNHVDEAMLREQQRIPTAIDTLDWKYYSYVKAHPIEKWDVPTSILYASQDQLTPRSVVDDFIKRFHAQLTVLEGGEHWFDTQQQLSFLNQWFSDQVQ